MTDINLPIFIYGNDPIMVFIVKNELLVLEEIGELKNQFSLALHYLYKLSDSKYTRKSIPSSLIKYLKFRYQTQPCICGMYEFERYNNRCFTFKMAIDANNSKEIINFNNFAFLESNKSFKVYVNRYNYSLHLNAKDTFILLSNIVFESLGSMFDINEYLLTIPFVKKNFKEVFDRHSLFNKSGHIYEVELFCLDYFEYLLNLLESNQIEPEDIFRFSGSKIIIKLACFNIRTRNYVYNKMKELTDSLDSLPIIKQICYSIMFIHAKDLTFLPEFHKLYNRYINRIRKVLLKYSKKYPERYSGDVVNRKDLFKDILEDSYKYTPY